MILKIKRNVTVQMSADEWQIFSDMDNADVVAKRMSEIASTALSIDDQDEAIAYWNDNVAKFCEWGACDSEPTYEFALLCRRVFGYDA